MSLVCLRRAAGRNTPTRWMDLEVDMDHTIELSIEPGFVATKACSLGRRVKVGLRVIGLNTGRITKETLRTFRK